MKIRPELEKTQLPFNNFCVTVVLPTGCVHKNDN